jgi:hypothetical protein
MTGGLFARAAILAILAVVFGWSGIAKVGDRRGTALAFRDFGLPFRNRFRAGELLAATECATASVLLAGWRLAVCYWLGLISAVLLSGAFVAVLARALGRGETFACRCFGAGDKPISNWTLARAITLLIIGMTGLVIGPPAAPIELRDAVTVLLASVSGVFLTATVAVLPTVWRPLDPFAVIDDKPEVAS